MSGSFFSQLVHEFERPFHNPVLVFFVILFIILLSPILLRKLKIPGIIGLIISGVLVGPHGINLLEQNAAVNLFSTIGLLYLMFIAGLELDLKEFQQNKNKSLGFGFLTFSIPLLIGFPVCHYFLNYNITASLLISSMFSTHTLVSYPIVSKFGISKNEAVAVTVGGTILTDTAVLILLAIILGSNNGDVSLTFWIRLIASLAVFSGFMFWVIPRVSAWFFQKLESEKTSHYIFVLSVVFLAAFLSELAGVEPIIGAFVAGLSLNKLIPASSSLMNRIEFIGNALFIPFFLISVGMLVDLSILFHGTTALVIAATLTVVAMVSKWLAATATSKLFRYSANQRKLIFGLSSSHAAATLAVITVGFQTKIIAEYALNGTILLILVTCLVATLVTENASRRIATSEKDEIKSNNLISAEEHLLIPIANLVNLERLLELAIFIRNKKSMNPITILSVVPNNEEAEKNLVKARKNLQSLEKMALASETRVNLIASIDYNIASGIIRASREVMADTIIIGWPGKAGLIERFTETKTASIISRTTKSVYICHFGFPLHQHRRIIVVCPSFAELEHGFGTWLIRITNLEKEIGANIRFVCPEKTRMAISTFLKENKINVGATFAEPAGSGDIAGLHNMLQPEDLLVVIAARRNSVSYDNSMDTIQEKLEKDFGRQSKIIVYPRTYPTDNKYNEYNDLNPQTFGGLKQVTKISHKLEDLVKKHPK